MFFSFLLLFTLTSNTIDWNITHSKDEVSFSTYQNYDIIRIENSHNNSHIGYPSLPSVALHISIPRTSLVSNVYFENQEWVSIGRFNIIPSQPAFPYSIGPAEFQRDDEIYLQDEFYPENSILNFRTGNKSGFMIAAVNYCPFRYNPVSGQLQILSSGRLIIKYEEGLEEIIYLTPSQYEVFSKDVKNIVVNQEIVDFNAPLQKDIKGSLYEYIIVTTPDLMSSFDELIKWKTQRGIKAVVISQDWIYSNYNGYDNMEKIRNFVRDYHQNHGLIYFVMAGDYDNLGARKIHAAVAEFNIEDDLPSDLYFSDIIPYASDWDGNNNHIYGEFEGDSCDWYSDVYVGRFPLNTTTEVDIWVNKLLTYEKEPPAGFIERSLQGGAALWPENNIYGGAICDTVIERLPLWWSNTKMYEDSVSCPTGFVDTLNLGYNWCHIAAHGWIGGVYWHSAGPMINSNMADNLTNNMKLSVIHANSCYPGCFDGNECLAEHIFNSQNGGAIAIMMNARYGIGDGLLPYLLEGNGLGPSEYINIWTVEEMFQNNNWNIGRAHGLGKDNSIPVIDSAFHWCMTELNLFGDPETQIYTREPILLNVNHNPTVLIGQNNFQVNVTDARAPVSGAVCCLSREDGSVWYKDITDISGNSAISYNITTTEDVILTVYAHDHIYYCDTISVSVSNSFISFLFIDSVDGGFNNNQFNSNCSYDISIAVTNFGNLLSTNTKATLFSQDTNIIIDTDTLVFGNIAPNDTVVSSNFAGINIQQSIPDTHDISITLACFDENDSIWESNFNIRVNSPKLEILNVEGPGFIEPGDSIIINPNMYNYGTGTGFELLLNLYTSDSFVSILKPVDSISSLLPGDTQPADFKIYISENIPEPYFVELVLSTELFGEYLFFDTFGFSIGGNLFSENFDDSLIGWTFAGPGSWHITEHNSYNGNNSMYCGIENTWLYTNMVINSMVITPEINVLPGAQMSFWQYYDIFDRYDKVQVKISTDGGSNWELLYPEEGYTGVYGYSPYDSIYTGDYKNWHQQHINFNYNSNVKIAWFFSSNPVNVAEGYYFDDIDISLNSGFVNIEEENNAIPNNDVRNFSLENIYPNPFVNYGIIQYSIGDNVNVSLKIYDLCGREISTLVNNIQNPGIYRIQWDGRDNKGYLVSSGSYFYKLNAGIFTESKKFTIIR